MPLFVIILMVILSVFFDLESRGVVIVGSDISTGFPAPTVPDFSYFIPLIPGAIVLAVVSYMGSIALAKRFHQQTLEEYKTAMDLWNDWNHSNDQLDTNGVSGQSLKSKESLKASKSSKSAVTPLLST